MRSLLFSLSIVMLLLAGLFLVSCQSKGVKQDAPVLDVQELTKNQPEVHGQEFKEGEIVFPASLDQAMATKGNATYSLKCQSCHRLTEERLVGPGWKGVTQKRNPIWIANMITNVDMMLETDPEAQKLLEQCLVRMPNQNITKEEARELIEFMRKNDGVK